MSGVAALFHRDGRPAEGAALRAMLGAAPYRGPDGMWVQCWQSTGLGHAKMAVTPEDEADQQPLVSPRTGCAIVADVRLDNRDELRSRLSDRPAASASDADLILRAYEQWGVEAAGRLLGDFAYMIWDPRRGRLVCARDTSGQRTLFYRCDGRTFAAASEIQQLLQDPTVPVAPNDAKIREYLIPTVILGNAKDQAPDTFYAGVFGVPAGHVLVVDRERLQVRSYWDLDTRAELRYRTDEAYAEHFRELFLEVLRGRLRSARPVGAMLSGGLDSSSLVCSAQELYRSGRAVDRGFVSYSLTFDGLDCDERDFIEEIQAKYQFRAEYIPLPPSTDRLQLQPSGFQHSPFASSTRIAEPVFSAASRAGVRAILTGDMAENCVEGSRLVFDSLLRQGKFREFWQRLDVHRRSPGLRNFLLVYGLAPLLPLAWQKRVHAALVRRTFRRTWDQIMPYWVSPALREEVTRRYRARCLERARERRFASPARQADYDRLYPPEAAPHPAPWPLEIWRPFADRRLHEFLLSIPPEQKFAPHPATDEFYAGSKHLLRRAMRGILPERVRTRTDKTEFGSVFQEELRRRWRDYESVFGPRGRSKLADFGYIDREQFWARLQHLRAGDTGADFLYVLRIVGLETWLRTFERREQFIAPSCLCPTLPSSGGAPVQIPADHTSS